MDYLADLADRAQKDFVPNMIALVQSLFQFFSDLFKYITGEGPAPEIDPVNNFIDD